VSLCSSLQCVRFRSRACVLSVLVVAMVLNKNTCTWSYFLVWIPCAFCYVASLLCPNVSTVEGKAIWWITRTRFKCNTRRFSEERRCSYLTVLLSLQSFNWPQMRNSMLFYRLEIGCIWESLWGEPSPRPQEPGVWRCEYKSSEL